MVLDTTYVVFEHYDQDDIRLLTEQMHIGAGPGGGQESVIGTFPMQFEGDDENYENYDDLRSSVCDTFQNLCEHGLLEGFDDGDLVQMYATTWAGQAEPLNSEEDFQQLRDDRVHDWIIHAQMSTWVDPIALDTNNNNNNNT